MRQHDAPFDGDVTLGGDFVRDPLANPAAVAAVRSQLMSERLAVALSWNKVTAELRMGLTAVRRASDDQ